MQTHLIISFRAVLVIPLIILFSCNSYRKKTFLDFEFGMTYKEYQIHANNLLNSGIITNLTDREFDYAIKLSDSSHAFFQVHAYVYSNARLSMLQGKLKHELNELQRRQLCEIFTSKHGKPSEPLAKYDNNIWRAAWDQENDIMIRLNFFPEYDPSYGYGSMIFMATGNLGDNIKAKDKKDNGVIDVDNKY